MRQFATNDTTEDEKCSFRIPTITVDDFDESSSRQNDVLEPLENENITFSNAKPCVKGMTHLEHIPRREDVTTRRSAGVKSSNSVSTDGEPKKYSLSVPTCKIFNNFERDFHTTKMLDEDVKIKARCKFKRKQLRRAPAIDLGD